MNQAVPIRIVLVDDHPLYRDGVATAIRDDERLDLVGEAGRGSEAVAMVRDTRPDVAVVDLWLPDLGGPELLAALSEASPTTRLLVLSASTVGAAVYESFAAGAAGYLAKDVGRRRICDAIRDVAHGRTVMDADLQLALAEHVRARHADQLPRLTDREHQILRLLSAGHTAPAIARELHIGTTTVKTHLQRIYQKLGVTDRAAAAAAAVRHGLID